MSHIVDLLTGKLDYAHCDAGCRLSTRASIFFQDTERRRQYVAPGDLVDHEDITAAMSAELSIITEVVKDVVELRRIVTDLIDRRVRVFLPVITSGPDGAGDTDYLRDKWRLFTAPVMAAVGVSLTGRVPRVSFRLLTNGVEPADRQEYTERFLESRQAGIWSSMLIDWANGEGVGSFEEDLTEYVDRTTLLGDPLRFARRLADVPPPTQEELASTDTYRQEALRASLYARADEPDPLADRWAVIWLWWELRLRIAGGGGVAEVSGLAVSVKRLHRTIPPDSARYAGAELLGQTLAANRDGLVTWTNVESFMTCLREAYHEAGFDEQHASIYDGTRLHHPIGEVADLIIAILNHEGQDVDSSLRIAQAEAKGLVEACRVDDLKWVVDAMLAAYPAKAVDVTLWHYRQLIHMRMPTRLIDEAGEAPAPDEERFPAATRSELLQLRTHALRMLGRQADALALLDSAPREVLDEPSGKQGLGIARARLVRELGSPAAALTQLEALLAETTDPQPSLYESLMATLIRFGRYPEAADHARAAYSRALRDRETWSVGRFAAQAMWCQAIGGREPDTDLIGPAMGEHLPADPGRDLIAATALLTTGVAESDTARREFLDRVRTDVETVLVRALAERDVSMANRVLYVSALYDQAYRPDRALSSWLRMLSVTSNGFRVTTLDGHLYTAANLIVVGRLALARSLLTHLLGGPTQLGHDSRLSTAALAGGHTAREIDLVTAAMFAEPGATQADLRLVGELRRGMASRAALRTDEEPAWRRHGLNDKVVAEIAPDRGRVGVLEWVGDGTDVRALITVIDAAGSVASTAIPLPNVDLGQAARRMRSRLSTWRAGRVGDPFGVAEWQVCRTWLDRLLDDHLAPDDHLVVFPFASWRQLPWHVAAFDRVTSSYEPSWVALLSTVSGAPSRERWREGVVAVPRMGDPAEITDAMARYVDGCGDRARVLDGVAADRDAVTDLLANVDLATLLTHGYTSAAESEVALMLAADGSLPLAHSVAASSERGRSHRFGWREYAELPRAPRVILSAACSTGGGHIVGLGEHLGIYNVLRQVGLRAFMAPQWDIVASDVLPILGDIRTLL
ncbi:MAG: CHAT domain-containing protein, partial [Actinomycetes bacterium]